MPKFILLIESATDTCSAALSDGQTLLAQKICRIGKSHDTILAPFAESILSENGLKAKDLAAVAVSEGPGSYMGLRIGVSLAKGIAYAANTKLIGISTLEVIAQCALDAPSYSTTVSTHPSLRQRVERRRLMSNHSQSVPSRISRS